jgi:hypothetical protein
VSALSLEKTTEKLFMPVATTCLKWLGYVRLFPAHKPESFFLFFSDSPDEYKVSTLERVLTSGFYILT